ncbi:MAG TPA: hypothetical protein PKD51_10065 [Saprospiraceae bacterium]|nr:hypothetical protein [Saprospiraceae bacterium]HMU05110.1 hypothetical protein [Saprospiraceae bacterium]
MSFVEKYQCEYEIAFPIFNKLFQLNKNDFINLMKEIFHDNGYVMEILNGNPKVIKTLNDDIAEEIQLHFYDSILINWSGVKYKPEHGSLRTIAKFNKDFIIRDTSLSMG